MTPDIQKLRELLSREPLNWETTDGNVWAADYDGHGEPVQVLLATTEADRANLIAEMRNALPAILDRLEGLEKVAAAAKRVDEMRVDGFGPYQYLKPSNEESEALEAVRFALAAIGDKP